MVTSGIVLRDYQHNGANAARECFTHTLSKECIDYRKERLAAYEEMALRRPKDQRVKDALAFHRGNVGQRRVRSVVCVAPTGAGKGTVAAYVLTEAAKRGNRSIFIVHTREIVKDVHRRLLQHGAPAGVILAGEREQPDLPIQVCSLKTLWARGIRPPAEFVVWDECHHCTASTYRDVAAAYPHAKHFAMTATPMRADQTPLGDVFDTMVELASVRQLIDLGWLVPVIVDSPEEFTGNKLVARPVDKYLEKAADRQGIVFAPSVPTAEQMAIDFCDAGVEAMAIHAGTPMSLREQAIMLYRAGVIRVLVNVDVLTEGFDAPETGVVILARSYGSSRGYLQAVGRGMRSSPDTGKSDVIVCDLVGNNRLFGLPSEPRKNHLFGTPIVLQDPALAICPKCKTSVSQMCLLPEGSGCEKCGYKRPAKAEDVDRVLREITIEPRPTYEYVDQYLAQPQAAQ